MAKKKQNQRGVVYSTDPDYAYDSSDQESENALPPAEQQLVISLDRKARRGKSVTLIEGFVGPAQALKDLGKQLQGMCGVGGSAKNGQILLQGDFRDRVSEWLRGAGYRVKLRG
jgi:translation initiation factor 1